MFVDFDNMPLEARVWVYQANRDFNANEVQEIATLLKNFIENWNNHGTGLKGSFVIKYNQFIVLAVDEVHKEASGCSIDASVKVIQTIEQNFDVDLMNKLNITFKDGDHINLVSFAEFQHYVNEGKINENTIVFNNLVNTIADFKNSWEVKAVRSWHARFLKKVIG